MVCVHENLLKCVIHVYKRKNLEKNYFSSHKLPKRQSTSSWSQGILTPKGLNVRTADKRFRSVSLEHTLFLDF
jgi:hypothetical protein